MGWEFPKAEEVMGDFLVKAIWALIPNDKSLWASMVLLSCSELAHLDAVCSWATAHPNNLWNNFLLVSAHIDKFLMSPNHYHV